MRGLLRDKLEKDMEDMAINNTPKIKDYQSSRLLCCS